MAKAADVIDLAKHKREKGMLANSKSWRRHMLSAQQKVFVDKGKSNDPVRTKDSV